MNASETETEIETEAVESTPKRKSGKRDTKSLLVFFSFIAVLVILVALNMK